MTTGQIVSIRFDKGFAFILPDGQDETIFAHCTNFVHRDFDQLRGRERVQFRIVPDRVKVGRECALDVVVIG